MCYDVNYIYKQQLKRAKYHSDKKAIDDIEKEIEEHLPKQVYYVSGFSHPDLIIYTQEDPYMPVLSNWGFVPYWCKEASQADKLRNMCLNAVGETMFEKPSFKISALKKRAIVHLNGFYDHHHYKSKTYPFFIQSANHEPLTTAALYDEWTDRETGEILHTFTIVTTVANELMSAVHNKKKRMPLILHENAIDNWLRPIETKTEKELIRQLITDNQPVDMIAHPVGRLKGINAIGNVLKVTNKVTYPELAASEVSKYIAD